MIKKIVMELIKFYQTFLSFDRGLLSIIAPGGACKYSPTCSEYTKQQVERLGVLRGIILGGRRILSCR